MFLTDKDRETISALRSRFYPSNFFFHSSDMDISNATDDAILALTVLESNHRTPSDEVYRLMVKAATYKESRSPFVVLSLGDFLSIIPNISSILTAYRNKATTWRNWNTSQVLSFLRFLSGNSNKKISYAVEESWLREFISHIPLDTTRTCQTCGVVRTSNVEENCWLCGARVRKPGESVATVNNEPPADGEVLHRIPLDDGRVIRIIRRENFLAGGE